MQRGSATTLWLCPSPGKTQCWQQILGPLLGWLLWEVFSGKAVGLPALGWEIPGDLGGLRGSPPSPASGPPTSPLPAAHLYLRQDLNWSLRICSVRTPAPSTPVIRAELEAAWSRDQPLLGVPLGCSNRKRGHV